MQWVKVQQIVHASDKIGIQYCIILYELISLKCNHMNI